MRPERQQDDAVVNRMPLPASLSRWVRFGEQRWVNFCERQGSVRGRLGDWPSYRDPLALRLLKFTRILIRPVPHPMPLS